MLADVTVEEWVTAGAVALGAILGTVLIGRVVMAGLTRRLAQPSLAVGLVVRIVRWTVLLFGFIYAASIVGVQIGPLIGALGLGGLAIALALQPVLQNLFAGVVLQTERPLECGEEITTNGHDGVVVEVTGRAVMLKTFDGELVTIPNSMVLDSPLVNHSREGHRRSRVEVGVAYRSDLPTVTDVLRTAVAAADGVRETPEPTVVARSFADSSIEFQIDFWHRATNQIERETRAAVILSVHAALADAGITIPFPQRDVHLPPAG
ncbi:MAG: mechanosensitive ion channel family protein [Acidimicrobiales bacterium]|nr:mechanosensitive ion channel family protein [Acidimicrobiales bacterium]